LDEPTTYTLSGPAFLAQLQHLGADLVQRLVPADALVLAAHQLHRVLQAVLAVAVLAQRRALGAVRAQVDGRVEHRLLPHPDAVLDHRVDAQPTEQWRAHRALDLDLAAAVSGLGGHRPPGLLDQRQLRGGQAGAHAQAGAAQEGARRSIVGTEPI
jgi:hypothetical protein